MRSSETSGTPATTRKRGRNQTSAAGSLSLLAVPKLKISDQTPPHLPAVELSGRAPPKEGIKQPPGRQTLLSKSPKQQIKPVAAAIPGGKENRPVRLNQPAQAGTVKPPVRQATVRASRTPQKDSATHAALPAPCTSDRQSVGLQHSTKIQGLSATASISGTAVDTQSARPDLILAKHDQGTCASSVCREADQALMAQGLPLACHTAINKRRCG